MNNKGQTQPLPPPIEQLSPGERIVNRLSRRVAQQETQIAALAVALEDAQAEIQRLKTTPQETEKKNAA